MLLFTHKPIRAALPEQQNPRFAVGPVALPRLEEMLSRLDIRGYGSGHLHHYALTRRQGVPVVSAPSTAFTVAAMADGSVTGPGLAQLGVVEWDLADAAARPCFRAPLDLVESGLLDLETVLAALEEMGVEPSFARA